MDRAAAELFLASLFVESTPERHEALRNAAKGARSWEGLPESLAAHGVLGLFLANLAAAGIELPAALAPTLAARTGEQRGADQRARLGLARFLAAAGRQGVEVTLVGHSALCFELYPEPLRRLGELELHVAPEHLARALRAGEEAGFLLAEQALPAWWHRRTHTALTLAPASSFLLPLRLATRLHHPSLLLTAREPEVLARRRRVAHEGHALFLLEPLDGLLELSVALARRAGEALLVSGRRHLLDAAARGVHPLRLDLLLDLRTFLEARHGDLRASEVLARASEWSAQPALRAALECLQMGLGFLPGAREWSRQVAQGLAAAAPPAANGSAPAQFRPDPVERLPQWLRPSDAFLARHQALPSGGGPRALRLARARHVAGVLGQCALAGAAFPLAVVARLLERERRRRLWADASTPQRMSDVNDAWRTAAARVEQQKPLRPRTIALPEDTERVAKYPDRYLG
ncbi:MAG TPA: nucleotidyltransferase family protein [Planctomycetota bacterium]